MRDLSFDDVRDPFIRIASAGAGMYIPVIGAANIITSVKEIGQYFDRKFPEFKQDVYEGIFDSINYHTGVRDPDRYYDADKWLAGETGQNQTSYAWADVGYTDQPW